MKPSTIARPIQVGERVQVIDALRGFALFGILVVNITHFHFFWEPSGPIDKPVVWLVGFLATWA
ncbi:MAG: hypothetical protein ACR2H4_05850 [Pyrinomonadaceae bacterium]